MQGGPGLRCPQNPALGRCGGSRRVGGRAPGRSSPDTQRGLPTRCARGLFLLKERHTEGTGRTASAGLELRPQHGLQVCSQMAGETEGCVSAPHACHSPACVEPQVTASCGPVPFSSVVWTWHVPRGSAVRSYRLRSLRRGVAPLARPLRCPWTLRVSPASLLLDTATRPPENPFGSPARCVRARPAPRAACISQKWPRQLLLQHVLLLKRDPDASPHRAQASVSPHDLHLDGRSGSDAMRLLRG